MKILDKLHWIEENYSIYNIHYYRAGIGIQFFEGNEEHISINTKWREKLKTYSYYNSFEECIEAEYERLTEPEK